MTLNICSTAIVPGLLVCALGTGRLCASDEAPLTQDQPSTSFARRVVPFLSQFCTDCHGGAEPEAKLRLDEYQSSGRVQTDYEIWEKVLRMIRDRQMPPADMPQPDDAAVFDVIEAISAELDTFDCSQAQLPRRVTIRRLNRAEYNNTIRDLIGIDFRPADDFPSDDVGYGFDNIGDVLSLPPVLMEKYLSAAESIVDRAFSDEQARRRMLVHEPAEGEDRRATFRQNLFEFSRRAFRRPLREPEREHLQELSGELFRSGADRDSVTKAVFAAVLISPHFLFRIEGFDPDTDENEPLTDWELASRLSYFLWSSMPDDELFELAREGRLHHPEVLDAQIRRMLESPKSRALVENFAGQWLQLRDVQRFSPDPERFPDFDNDLRAAMKQETEHFFETILREDRSILEFLTADFTFMNERLAEHYGLEGIQGEEFRRVDLPPNRRGVLTQASILMITSNPTRTSPVKRGKWILENILGEPPPPPPPNVPELDEEAELLGSLRERMEQHRSNEACAVCHRQMDAIGFGMEHFDVIGAWRDRDGRFEIDSTGELPGRIRFDGAAELMQVLSDQKRDAFCRSLTEKMLTYAVGRGLDAADRCTVQEIMERLSSHDYRFSALIAGIVYSETFSRRGISGDD